MAKKGAAKAAARKTAGKQAAAPRKKAAAKRPRRDPTRYTPEVGELVCRHIAHGWTLRQIAADQGLPAKSTIIGWLTQHEDFRERYFAAREIAAMVMEDEIQEIADDSRNDWIERETANGEIATEVNHEALARSRLRIDARKWLMGKMQPRRYGERVAVTGKDGGPVEHEHRAIGGILDDLAARGADTGVG